VLPHVGTVDAARDMDVLRAALGDGRLTYIGKSYGTYLGATYAELFPKRVRALVLDGALDPSLSLQAWTSAQAQSVERAFRSFAKDCFGKADCPLKARTEKGALAEVAALIRGTDRATLKNTQDKRRIGETIAFYGVLTPLYDQQAWPILRQALAAAYKGDGTILLGLADAYFEREADGTFSNSTDANTAINCLDHGHPVTSAAYARQARTAIAKAPHLGPYVVGYTNPCVYWPIKSRADRPLHAKGAAPIVVVGTERDVATPFAWSKALASQLSSGVLIRFDGDGHTAYRTGSACVDGLVDRYLISGVAPKDGTRCPKI
jgi:pimeloyl-ACP methyl ester carboxylesterase